MGIEGGTIHLVRDHLSLDDQCMIYTNVEEPEHNGLWTSPMCLVTCQEEFQIVLLTLSSLPEDSSSAQPKEFEVPKNLTPNSLFIFLFTVLISADKKHLINGPRSPLSTIALNNTLAARSKYSVLSCVGIIPVRMARVD